MHFAQLDFSSASVWFIGAVVAGLVFFGGIFAALRTLRANVADEIKREISAGAAPARVDVAQPLVVRPHTEFATQTYAEYLKSEIEKIDTERRTSVAVLHQKIENSILTVRTELNAKIERLEGRIDAVPERTIKLLRETKDLI